MINIPNPLAKSFEGKYYVGYAEELTLKAGTNAWAGLFNPANSGIYMFVNVWTITELLEVAPVQGQIWFNANMPGDPIRETNVTTSNLALHPTPKPKVRILKASNVSGTPSGGVKAFVRKTEPGTTQVFEEDGKYIFAPGGNLSVFVSSPEAPPGKLVSVLIAFGWYEQKHYEL